MESRLLHSLEICRTIYNRSLELKKLSYEQNHKLLSLFDLNKNLTFWSDNDFSLKQVHSQVLQDCQTRVDLAYKAFFRRIKQGLKPGYPRFKGIGRYDSMTYKQSGFNLNPTDSTIYLSKIGRVPIILHRSCLGKIKTCTVLKSRTGKWFVTLSVEIAKPIPIPKTGQVAGLDMGLTTYIQASDGFKVKRQRFFKVDEHDLARAQRQLKKHAKGSPSRERVKKIISHIHERTVDRRNDFCYKTALGLVRRYDFMAVEDLSINSMMEEKKYSKSIADAAWAQLLQRLSCKAEEAGKTVVAVDPRGTSQMCSQCGHIVHKDISIRIHHCPYCGLHIDRDLNASLNILRLGQQSVEYRDFVVTQRHG
jgi:putative transposase